MQRTILSSNGNKFAFHGFALFAAILLTVGACTDSTGPERSTIQVLLTDAPHEELDTALVWISRIYLQGGGDAEGDTTASDTTSAGRVDLFHDPGSPLVFDLLQLRDGVTADLTGLLEVDAGVYQGLRFVVDSARVHLADGLTFPGGASWASLRIPSGSTSGIKVKLNDVLRADGGDTTSVTVDFDVDDNFKIQRSGPGGDIKQVIFTPVLKEKGRTRS